MRFLCTKRVDMDGNEIEFLINPRHIISASPLIGAQNLCNVELVGYDNAVTIAMRFESLADWLSSERAK